MGLLRQSAVSTVSKPGEQRQSAVTSLTAFSLGIRLDFVVTANFDLGISLKRDTVGPRVFVSRQRRCYKTHFHSELNFDKIRSYCTLPL